MPDYRKAARRAARRRGIDPDLFERQIGAESGFNPRAGSPAGARGIAQFMPATAKGMGVDLNDGRAADDLDGAARLMASYVRKFGSYEKALRAYNAGPGAVEKSRGYGETNAYVRKILQGRDSRASGSARSGRSGEAGTRTRTRTETTPGVDRSADRRQMLASYLLSGQRHQPGGLLELKQGLDATPDTPSRTKTIRENVRSHERARKPAEAGGGANSTTIRQLMRVARRDFGLTISENGLYDKVDPVHTEGSYHYRKTKGGGTDAAADISGPPEKMAAFARYVARRHGKDVEELIWRGRSPRAVKRGKRVSPGLFSGHTDHVHVADTD